MPSTNPWSGPASLFLVAHATHPDWRAALALATSQLSVALAARSATPAMPPMTLGFVYFSDHYASDARGLVQALREHYPGVGWVGSVGVGVAAGGVEYIDEPALVLMLAPLPAGSFEVFSGAQPLRQGRPHTALVHADGRTPDLTDLIVEMSRRTQSGYVFGGLASSRHPQAWHVADGAWQGGLSGVAFGRDIHLLSRVTQGCQPLGPARAVTACERHVALQLDGQPALSCLLKDLGLEAFSPSPQNLQRLRSTLVGLAEGAAVASRTPRDARQFGSTTRVRHLVGLDPARQGVAVAEGLSVGMQLSFCQRDAAAARRDLVRLCSEIREELEGADDDAPRGASAPARILGALYVSCAGRGGPHFGGPSAELKIVQHALGVAAGQEIPLVGFFAGGEIAASQLYAYTGVLTVFTDKRQGEAV